MYGPERTLAAVIHADRVREIERRARIRRLQPAPISSEPFRRIVGRRLVRIGERLAGDSSLQPTRSL